MSKVIQIIEANKHLVVLTDDGRIFRNPHFGTLVKDEWYEVKPPVPASPPEVNDE